MTKIRVILTAVGAPGAPTIIKALREDENIEIIGTDIRDEILGKYLVNKFYRVHRGTTPNFIEDIERIVIKNKVDVIIPLATLELNNLAKHKSHFEEKLNCKICVSDYETLEVANNKIRLYEMFDGENFIPRFIVPRNMREFEEAVYELGYPKKYVCVKIPVGHGSRGFRIISSDTNEWDLFQKEKPSNVFIDLERMKKILRQSDSFPEILVSEYLPGEEWGADTLIDPTTHRLISVVIRKNTSLNLSIPVACTIRNNEEIKRIVNFIVKKLKLAYAVNFDFKYDENGKAKLLEINPRLSASCILAVKAGVNLPLLIAYMALGKKVEIKNIREEITAYFYRDVFFIE